MDNIDREIELILSMVEKKKQYHLLQTNVNERDDLSQELDILIYEKLKVFLVEKESPNLTQYLKETIFR